MLLGSVIPVLIPANKASMFLGARRFDLGTAIAAVPTEIRVGGRPNFSHEVARKSFETKKARALYAAALLSDLAEIPHASAESSPPLLVFDPFGRISISQFRPDV